MLSVNLKQWVRGSHCSTSLWSTTPANVQASQDRWHLASKHRSPPALLCLLLWASASLPPPPPCTQHAFPAALKAAGTPCTMSRLMWQKWQVLNLLGKHWGWLGGWERAVKRPQGASKMLISQEQGFQNANFSGTEKEGRQHSNNWLWAVSNPVWK